MAQVAVNIQTPQRDFTVLEGGKKSEIALKPSKEMLLLSAILIGLQIADGVLTALGMGVFGTNAEGNILLRLLMEWMGYIPALVCVKTFAIAVIIGLCHLSVVVQWLPRAMKGLIAIYMLLAIIPWTYILLTQPVL